MSAKLVREKFDVSERPIYFSRTYFRKQPALHSFKNETLKFTLYFFFLNNLKPSPGVAKPFFLRARW